MGKTTGSWGICGLLALAACAPEPTLVASNCDDPKGCAPGEALKIDAVDILLVIDDSGSIASSARALKAELPRLVNALISGDAEDTSFPAARSVHVAVTTSDMGVGQNEVRQSDFGCSAVGRDGVFVKLGEREPSCEVDHPAYLAFEGGPAPLATVENVGCVPLVTSEPDMDTGHFGCGFEQPLEAALKSLWPAADSAIEFVSGHGHGQDENAGFLREDSLLVVMVVSDEDDCSTTDNGIFDGDVHPSLRCQAGADKLQRPSRYVDSLKALRPGNPNVIFGVIAGVPAELVSTAFRGKYDLASENGTKAYYDAVLADDHMQEIDNGLSELLRHLEPSCTIMHDNGSVAQARPPRRLLEVAKGFGTRSVIGSLCAADFGATTGRLIRAIGEQLSK